MLYEFPQKWFKITERHSLAVCSSLWGEKQFLLIFIPFYWFEQKKKFKQILIFLSICQFSNMVRKHTFWVFQCSFMRVIFRIKREVLYELLQKCFKTTERHSLAVCGSLCGEKQFLLIFIPFTGLIKNSCVNKSKFSLGFASFKHGKKYKLSENFSARF